jgi:hypothetical protein
MESFLAGERGTVSAIDGPDTALVRMDEDDMEYPLPQKILAPSGTRR